MKLQFHHLMYVVPGAYMLLHTEHHLVPPHWREGRELIPPNQTGCNKSVIDFVVDCRFNNPVLRLTGGFKRLFFSG